MRPLPADLATLTVAADTTNPPCRDEPETFFPEFGDNVAAQRARRLCSACPIAVECATYALRAKERHGIWGGLTPNQRTLLRRGR